LHAAVLEVHAQRDEREALLRHLASHLLDFVAMQQELALAFFVVAVVAGVTVRADVDVAQPDFALVDARIAVAQVDAPLTDRLHLGTEQRHAGFPLVEDVVVVQCLAVVGDVFLRLFALGFLRHGSGSGCYSGPAEAGHYTLSRYQTQASAFVVVSDTGGDRTLDGRRPFRGDAWPQRLVDTEHRAVECLAIRLDPRVALLAGYGLHRRRRCREP